MVKKKIAQNQGQSGRINLSGSELDKFDAEVGDPIEVDVAESDAVAQAMIDSKDSESYIIISKSNKSEVADL
jgi:hypothetical protein